MPDLWKPDDLSTPTGIVVLDPLMLVYCAVTQYSRWLSPQLFEAVALLPLNKDEGYLGRVLQGPAEEMRNIRAAGLTALAHADYYCFANIKQDAVDHAALLLLCLLHCW